MMLIAVGENFKKIDKETDGNLLNDYPNINWTGVKGIRDGFHINILTSTLKKYSISAFMNSRNCDKLYTP